jgi:hypothetical protein
MKRLCVSASLGLSARRTAISWIPISVLGGLLLACSALPAFAAEDLDKLYGVPYQPNYIKHYEADQQGKVLLNPYLQVATKAHPGILDPKGGPYSWTIDAEGRMVIIEEVAHPYGYTYEKVWFRPEDKTKRKPASETFGHVSATAGGPGRISGEILYDGKSRLWVINNKSGRYTRLNADRTPDKLLNAAKLLREVVDPGSAAWGPVYYLLEYAPVSVAEEFLKSPELRYEDGPTLKTRPYIELR